MRPSLFLREAASAFKVVGQAPYGFSAASSGFNARTAGLSAGYGVGYRAEHVELAAKWAKGVKVFHDDYGYGVIVQARENSEEFVIEVQFENGGRKKFLPQYQAKSLTIIKD
jgi:DNA helicase-2/ATP-dependent DNA helicase PcrA